MARLRWVTEGMTHAVFVSLIALTFLQSRTREEMPDARAPAPDERVVISRRPLPNTVPDGRERNAGGMPPSNSDRPEEEAAISPGAAALKLAARRRALENYAESDNGRPQPPLPRGETAERPDSPPAADQPVIEPPAGPVPAPSAEAPAEAPSAPGPSPDADTPDRPGAAPPAESSGDVVPEAPAEEEGEPTPGLAPDDAPLPAKQPRVIPR